MADGAARGHQTVTLKSGRAVTLRPFPMWGLDGLMKSVMRANLDVLQEMADHSIDAHTAAATICALMGSPDRWAIMGTPHTLTWLVGSCIVDVKRDKSGAPDIDEYDADEITELLPTVMDMNSFETIGSRVGKSLLPAVRSIHDMFGTGGSDHKSDTTGATKLPDNSSDTTT